MNHQSFNHLQGDELSLKDIINFLVDSWMVIVGVGLLGLIGAIWFNISSPDKYQATIQIQMAQTFSNNVNNSLVNAEEYSILVARLKLPSNYSIMEIVACGVEQAPKPYETLAYMIVPSLIKGSSSAFEIKILMESRSQLLVCANAIFEKIRGSQNLIIKPYVEDAQIRLKKYQLRLQEAKATISLADKAGFALSAAYLAARDDVRYINDEISRLNYFIKFTDYQQAKLISPIYIPETPYNRSIKVLLLVGLLAGLFLGFLLALFKRAFRGLKKISANLH